MLGENIRSQRQVELATDTYGFISSRTRRREFLALEKLHALASYPNIILICGVLSIQSTFVATKKLRI